MTRSLRAYTGVIAVALLPVHALAQDPICAEPVPRFGDGLIFFDRVISIFNRVDSAFAQNLTSGTARLDPAVLERYRLRVASIHTTLGLIVERNTPEMSLQLVYADLGAYQDFVRAGFSGGTPPPEIERLLCPLRTSYIRWVRDQLAEHERKLNIRHGALSERLNVVEMLLNEWMSRKSAMGALRDPPHFEWILRAQVVGFQYEQRAGHIRPGSPTYQVGTSYYFFGDNGFMKWLNHVGVAAAYQHDLVNREDLYGGVLHVQQYDIGFLCPRRTCKDWTIVASKNLSFLPGTWVKMRQSLAKR